MPGTTEYLFLKFFMDLYKKGIRRVNMGGSETESLHKFKMKFYPEKLTKMYYAIFSSHDVFLKKTSSHRIYNLLLCIFS